jgi:hypothetical protein
MRKILLVLAMTCVGTSAMAGWKVSGEALLITGNYVSGNMAMVRSSPDSVEYLGCRVIGYPTYTGAYCYARNASGVVASCWTTTSSVAAALGGMNDDSSLKFQWDASGACQVIEADTYSMFAPKAP